MRDLLLRILNEYEQARTEDFKGHVIADYLRKDSREIIIRAAVLSKDRYLVEGSPGKGNWAMCLG